MSSLDAREIEIRRRLRDDFEHYANRCLCIRTKSGAIERFRLNRSQRHLHTKIEEQRARTGRVRAVVLKGRQVGISTYIAGRFYWRISHTFGFRAFILAHLDDASSNLFDVAKRFHEHCPDIVRPETGRANAKELLFSGLDSGYKVATAGSADVGRSNTIQLFHGSEAAFWPNAQSHSAGIKQAIADAPGTEDIRESTANGVGNPFYQEWKAAERGDSDYMPVFIPWYWHEEYESDSTHDWEPPEPWRGYGQLYGLSRGQVHWAWRKNRDMAIVAGGSSDEPCWQFRQEFPANADEAFQTSGVNSFIGNAAVMRARKAQVVGYGPVILGVDPARGGGDKTGLVDRQGRRLGERVCRRIDSDDLMAVAGEVVRTAAKIKAAKVVVDTTGLGAGLYDRLRETLGDIVEAVNFGARAREPDRYANRRAEIWDKLREWFEDPAGVQVPDDDALQSDVCGPQVGSGATRFDSSGRLIIEAKEKIKERLGASPDIGDAAALTFAVQLAVESSDDWDSWATPARGGWLSS